MGLIFPFAIASVDILNTGLLSDRDLILQALPRLQDEEKSPPKIINHPKKSKSD
jgi:hypothetical protein